MRTIACALDRRLTSIAQTRLTSSRGLQAISRSASSIAGLAQDAARRPVARDGADVIALAQGGEALVVGVDDDDVVVVVQAVHQRAAHVPGADDDDPHGAQRTR